MQTHVCNITESISTIIRELQKGSLQVAKLLETREVEYSLHSNASGDNQLKVDIAADNLFAQILCALPIKGFASEERESIEFCATTDKESHEDSKLYHKKNVPTNQNAHSAQSDSLSSCDCVQQHLFAHNNAIRQDLSTRDLLVSFDPLDGSSLMDSNLSVGSIFGIYADTFAPQNLIASLYFLYGPRLELVIARDLKTSHYLYNRHTERWDFIQDFKLKQKGKINAPGGTQKYWDTKHFELIQSFFKEGYRLRYSGGMVPDLHQILCKGGGIFSYPATSDSPKGKLRKLFEVYPFALIFEYAGGKAIDGKKRLLDGKVKNIHETTSCFFGSNEEIQRVLES